MSANVGNATTLFSCGTTTGCLVFGGVFEGRPDGGFANYDYTVPGNGQRYRWDIWSDTPGLTISLEVPNEVFEDETVSNGDGTFHPDSTFFGGSFNANELIGTVYNWTEIQAPSHTTIYVQALQTDFNTCSPSSPAGVCRGTFNIWGNDGTLTTGSPAASVRIFTSFTTAPEPGTWGLMLLGFFGLGSVLRGRRPDPGGIPSSGRSP